MPRIFVGAAGENHAFVEKLVITLHEALGGSSGKFPNVDVEPWYSHKNFPPNIGTLQAILDIANDYDFGVFVMEPDDQVIRGIDKTLNPPALKTRDNVVFEFGLFLGQMGPKRAFGVSARPKEMTVATDLLGITFPRLDGAWDAEGTWKSMLQVIIELIREGGIRPFQLISGWRFQSNISRFQATLNLEQVKRHWKRLEGNYLVLCYRRKSGDDIDNDTKIVIGTPVKLGLRNPGPEINVIGTLTPPVKKGEIVEGFLLLMPSNVDISSCGTIDQLKNKGCWTLDEYLGTTAEE